MKYRIQTEDNICIMDVDRFSVKDKVTIAFAAEGGKPIGFFGNRQLISITREDGSVEIKDIRQ